MNPKAAELKAAADLAKQRHMLGQITYEECVAACKAYIDFANELAVDIAKRYGMRPKKMNVKAYMR